MPDRISASFERLPIVARVEQSIITGQALFLHSGLFVMAVLIGIARYNRFVPLELTVGMTVWSLALLCHGALIYRLTNAGAAEGETSRDGILSTALASIAVNAIMWLMWGLATDARDSSPWHLSVWLVFLALAVSGLIAGKRALYRRWLHDYLRASEHGVEDTKQKRSGRLQLSDDGELTVFPEDGDVSRLSDR